MKLAKISCENVAGVPNGVYSFVPQGKKLPEALTLVAGVRGAGKTCFLKAIVALKELVGAYVAAPARKSLREPSARSGRLGGTFLLSDEEAQTAELTSTELDVDFSLGAEAGEPPTPLVRKLFSRYTHDRRYGKLEYFPSSRRLSEHGPATQEREEKMLRAGANPAKYSGLVRAMVMLAVADGTRALEETSSKGILLGSDAPDSLGPYKRALSALCPELRLRGPVLSGETPTLLFDRVDGETVELLHLSDGQKQGLLLAGTVVRLGLAHSIILVDSPELHVHVADQSRFLQALITLEEDNQWIVATGSGEIMKGARREQVIALAKPK